MKKTYQVDSRKPSPLPKIGSVAVAIGSLSLAATSIAPSVLAFANLSTSNPTQESGQLPNGTPANGGTSVAAGDTANSQTNEDPGFLGQVQVLGANPDELPATSQPIDPTAVAVDQALVPLTPPSSGNISSATPTAGVGAAGSTSANGNLSSATPAGGVYEDDEDDEDEDEREDHDDDEREDHDDDDEDDD
jgi:hypothetical protein